MAVLFPKMRKTRKQSGDGCGMKRNKFRELAKFHFRALQVRDVVRHPKRRACPDEAYEVNEEATGGCRGWGRRGGCYCVMGAGFQLEMTTVLETDAGDVCAAV